LFPIKSLFPKINFINRKNGMEISVVCIKGKEVFRMGKSFAMWYILLIHGSLFFVFFSLRNARKSHKENIAGTAKGCFEEDE